MTELQKLKQKDPKTIEKLYLENKSAFLSFAAKFKIDPDELLDIYQDAFVALVENAAKGKLDDLKSEIKTYLFSIGKYMVYARLKKDKSANIDIEKLPENFEWETIDETEDLLELLEKKLSQIGEQCFKILKMFYYENLKLNDILEVLPYQSKDVLKSQKSRCLKQLKELILKK